MYAARTRFIPDSILHYFESCAWPVAAQPNVSDNSECDPVNIGAQIRQVGENLKAALAAAGATLADLVRTQTFTTDIDEFFKHVDVRMEAEIDWSCEDQADWSKRVDVAVGGGSGVSHKLYEKTPRKGLAENPRQRAILDAQLPVLKID